MVSSTLGEGGWLMRKGNCFNHLLFTLLMWERFHPKVMGMVKYIAPNTEQETLTTVYQSQILTSWGRRRRSQAMQGHIRFALWNGVNTRECGRQALQYQEGEMPLVPTGGCDWQGTETHYSELSKYNTCPLDKEGCLSGGAYLQQQNMEGNLG